MIIENSHHQQICKLQIELSGNILSMYIALCIFIISLFIVQLQSSSVQNIIINYIYISSKMSLSMWRRSTSAFSFTLSLEVVGALLPCPLDGSPSSNEFIWDMAFNVISKSGNSGSRSHSLVRSDLYSSFLYDKRQRLEWTYTSSSAFFQPNPFHFTEWMKPYVLHFLFADEELATCDNILLANFWIFGIFSPWKFHQLIRPSLVLSRIVSISVPKF